MSNGKCESWTCDKTGWWMALGGVAVGYVVTQMMARRSPRSNPGGGTVLDVDGMTVYARVSGFPAGTVGLYVQRPSSRVEDSIGVVEHSKGGMFRAFPPVLYEKLGVRSTISRFILDDGVIKRNLNLAAHYLVGIYKTHYEMSNIARRAADRLYKRELGERFSTILGVG